MNALWSYFWPCFALGLLVGGPAGTVAFRRRPKRNPALAIGLAVSMALGALWHGPLGGAHRFSTKVEGSIHELLVNYEMTQVTAHLHRNPLTRQVDLSGPADDFQRGELARLIGLLPGVGEAKWNPTSGGVPLIVEGLATAVVGFLSGLVLAYLVELRRRYNSQWKW